MGLRVMVINITFNNVSVISWQSVVLVGGNHRPVANPWPTLPHNVISSVYHLCFKTKILDINCAEKHICICVDSFVSFALNHLITLFVLIYFVCICAIRL